VCDIRIRYKATPRHPQSSRQLSLVDFLPLQALAIIMTKSTPSTSPAINPSPTSSQDMELGDSKQEIFHTENRNEFLAPHHKWKVSATGGGDTAMALFNSPMDVREAIHPEEERKLVRKIDWMILPYLSVCYAFFYVSIVQSRHR